MTRWLVTPPAALLIALALFLLMEWLIRPPQGPDDLVSRPLDERDVPSGVLLLGQLKHRALPVASARFADQLLTAFQSEFGVA